VSQPKQKLTRVDTLEAEMQKQKVALCMLINELRQIPQIPQSAFDLVEKILTS